MLRTRILQRYVITLTHDFQLDCNPLTHKPSIGKVLARQNKGERKYTLNKGF